MDTVPIPGALPAHAGTTSPPAHRLHWVVVPAVSAANVTALLVSTIINTAALSMPRSAALHLGLLGATTS